MRKYLVFFITILFMETAQAALKIDITRGNVEPLPIAIQDFQGKDSNSNEIGRQITEVIAKDLESSGLFRPINSAAFLEVTDINNSPVFDYWRKINATAVVAGIVESTHNAKTIKIVFKMWDPYAEVQTDAMLYKVDKSAWRRVAHQIADKIYQRITGETGYFDTRVLFVAESGDERHRIKKLAIMDQDGANYKTLTNGKELVLTPRFDHKNQRAIYMSYKNKTPQVYVLDLHSGWQKLIGTFPGMSFAPRFSPDGEHAIMSVAKGGSTNIYELNLSTGVGKKLTFDMWAINTSPSYSPNGSKIVFNSDRAGSRQLYMMNRDGSAVTRISHGDGSYATPVWSPRGDLIAFTKIYAGKFYIGVMRTDGTGERLLTTSWLDEGPTWSPNGRVIMFARHKKGGVSQLYAVDVTGYNERLITTETAASDPAWSPLLN